MKLLIITQKIDQNDPILGFFVRWVEEFSKNVDKLTVICLFEGEHSLPENVKVLSLGKENFTKPTCSLRRSGATEKVRVGLVMKSFLEEKMFSKIIYIWHFYKYIWQERKNYDSVFVHMNQIYVILGGIFWRLWHKKISLWYAHKQISPSLRIAEKITNNIFSVSKESFRLSSKKLIITGHGIDINNFHCFKKINNDKKIKILSVGRISEIKGCDILIKTVVKLKEKLVKPFEVVFVGEAITKNDNIYFEKLKLLISNHNLSEMVSFKGSVAPEDIKKHYCSSDISVNLTPTGGMDKVILESLASGTVAISSNKAFQPIFGKYANNLIFQKGKIDDLNNKIIYILENNNKKNEMEKYLYRQVEKQANITNLIPKIINILK